MMPGEYARLNKKGGDTMKRSALSVLLGKINTEIELQRSKIKMWRDVQLYLIKLEENEIQIKKLGMKNKNGV